MYKNIEYDDIREMYYIYNGKRTRFPIPKEGVKYIKILCKTFNQNHESQYLNLDSDEVRYGHYFIDISSNKKRIYLSVFVDDMVLNKSYTKSFKFTYNEYKQFYKDLHEIENN